MRNNKIKNLLNQLRDNRVSEREADDKLRGLAWDIEERMLEIVDDRYKQRDYTSMGEEVMDGILEGLDESLVVGNYEVIKDILVEAVKVVFMF